MGSIRSSSVHRFTTCLIGFSLLMAIHSENRDGEVGKLRRNYRPALAVLRNRGHDIMIVRTFIIGTTWNCYMVHRSSEGQFVVIAILYHLGRSDHFLDKVSGKGYNRHLAIM
ncbi:hypothetical protein SASPL_157407 [Salvia splendens]|uniref:Uncharacterized protein n=1 Tax=Salvia splendens TaxID=180675 RepID=A0A8X8YVI8_SALSN|nr:hypothetical protein SASPL_157407 [Salvia splendens]